MARGRPARILRKVVDEEHMVRCRSGSTGKLRIEAWEDRAGKIVRYNLAFIHLGLQKTDHGRVLGYDNSHGSHERHDRGKVSQVDFLGFEETFARFQREVQELREQA